MASDHIIDLINTQPGIQRDGTQFNSPRYIDGQWVRFYMGKPSKIGGRVLVDPGTTAIIRNAIGYCKQSNTIDCYLGRSATLNVANLTDTGLANPEFDRTPAGFVADDDNIWSFDFWTQTNEETSLGVNPLTTDGATATVVVSVASTAGLSLGQNVTISGAVDTGGILAANLNITAQITNIVLNTSFSYVANTVSTSAVSGGGTRVIYAIVSPTTYIVATAAPSLHDINNNKERLIYWGDVNATSALVPISSSNQKTAGFILAAPPYFIKGGNDGVIGWTLNPGGDWSDAHFAAITGTKLVYGALTRGGNNSPAFLIWSLNSLIRATFVGGDATFSFDTLQTGISIMSENSVVSVYNVFYWLGVNDFYVYNGVVKPLMNNTNKDWFFNNINRAHTNKVWGMWKPQKNEIWWYFPFGDSEECNKVLIFNIEEQTWSDANHARSAGIVADLFPYPLEADSNTLLNLNTPKTTITVALGNDPLLTTALSSVVIVTVPSTAGLLTGNLVTINGATAVHSITAPQLNIQAAITVINATSFSYVSNGTADGVGGSGGGNAVSYSYLVDNLCYGLWEEENGDDEIRYGSAYAIDSYFETSMITYFEKDPQNDRTMRMRRIEPDFTQTGDMTVTINMRAFAQSTPLTSQTYTFVPGQTTVELAKVDTVNNGRILSLRFESNTLGGSYLMGKVVLNYAPGDVRP